MIQEEFEQDQPKKSKKGLGKSRIIIIVLVLVVLAGAGAGAGFYLYNSEQKAKAAAEQAKKADPDKAAKRYDDLKIEVTVDADDPIYRKIDFAAAQAVNPDVYAWIWIPGTNVDIRFFKVIPMISLIILITRLRGWKGFRVPSIRKSIMQRISPIRSMLYTDIT